MKLNGNKSIRLASSWGMGESLLIVIAASIGIASSSVDRQLPLYFLPIFFLTMITLEVRQRVLLSPCFAALAIEDAVCSISNGRLPFKTSGTVNLKTVEEIFFSPSWVKHSWGTPRPHLIFRRMDGSLVALNMMYWSNDARDTWGPALARTAEYYGVRIGSRETEEFLRVARYEDRWKDSNPRYQKWK